MAKVLMLLIYRIKAYTFFSLDILKANFNLLKKPYKLTYVVTKKCNSKCLNCSIWKVKQHNDLDINQVQIFSKEMSQLKWIDFTGGEVTLRSDFIDIVKTFSNNCPNLLYVHFPTNGIQTESILETVKKLSKEKFKLVITVSIDGPEKINDDLRGVPGDYKNAIKTYFELKKIKEIDVYIGMTAFNSNHKSIKELYYSLMKEIPKFNFKDFHINLGHISSHYYGNQDSTNIKQSKEIIQSIESFQKSHGRLSPTPFSIINNLYRKKLKSFVKDNKTPISCRSARSTIYLSEEGELFPCSMWNYPLGNIKEKSYLTIQSSLRYENALQLIDKKKCANCWTPCEAYPSLLDNFLFSKN